MEALDVKHFETIPIGPDGVFDDCTVYSQDISMLASKGLIRGDLPEILILSDGELIRKYKPLKTDTSGGDVAGWWYIEFACGVCEWGVPPHPSKVLIVND